MKWYLKFSRVLPLAMMAVVLTSMFFFGCVEAAENGSGNSSNGGYVTSDGDYVYYSADDYLYKESLSNGDREIVAETGSCGAINVYDGYIYYQTYNFSGGVISRIATDGSDDEFVVYSDYDSYAQVEDGFLYYKNNNQIVKVPVDEIGENSLTKTELGGTFEGFVVDGNTIYFQNSDDSVGREGLASISTSGDRFRSLSSGTCTNINVSGSYVYYTRDNDIYRVDKDGGDEELLLQGEEIYYINVYGDTIYFVIGSADYEFGSISVSGGDKQFYDIGSINEFCIVNDMIYARDSDGYSNVAIFDLPVEGIREEDEEDEEIEIGEPEIIPSPGPRPSDSSYICSDWAKDEIEEAGEKGLIPNTLEGEDLTESIDRSEFAAIAVQLYQVWKNYDMNTPQSVPFRDIAGIENEDYVKKAYVLNITNGTSDTSFSPYTDINREQLATMLARTVKKIKFADYTIDTDHEYYFGTWSVKKFDDDDLISDYAKDSVYFFFVCGVIKGTSTRPYLFSPNDSNTRGDAYGAVSNAINAFATREQAVIMSLRIFNDKPDILDEVYAVEYVSASFAR